MWSARLRRQVVTRRAQRRAQPPKLARRGPVDASAWRRVSVRGVEMTVAAPDPSLQKFWGRVANGDWESETFDFLDRALEQAGPSPLFVDVGTWIGALTLYAAGKGARVLALEPDPAARSELLDNLKANPELAARVTVVAAAFDDRPQGLALYPHSKRFGASKTSSLPDPSGVAVVSPTLSAEALIERARRLGTRTGAVVTVGIEGHEFAIGAEIGRLIRGLGASALISMHPRSRFDFARRAGGRDAGAETAHGAAYEAARGFVRALRAEGLDPEPLRRGDAEALVFAGTQVFRRGPRPRNFDLTIPASAIPEKILD